MEKERNNGEARLNITKKIMVSLMLVWIATIIIYGITNKTIKIAKNEEVVEVAKESALASAQVTSRSSSEIDRKNIVNEVQTAGVSLPEDTTSVEDTESKSEETTTQEQEAVPEVTYISIEEVKISRDMDLTKRTGLSKEDFKTLIAGVKQDTSKFFYDNADTIYDLCEEYEINEIFFCGLISAESGWNIAGGHRKTHNYISLMANGHLINYGSVEEGLEVAAKKLHANYLTPGGRFYHGATLSGVKTNFCPASSTWVDLVYGRMNQIL